MHSFIVRGALCVAALLGVGSAHAATFTVMNNDDLGTDSLRQAILDANASAGADVVDLTGIGGMSITLTTGEILITEELTITGAAGDPPLLSGSSASRIFFINANVTISNVRFTDGLARGGNGGDSTVGGHGGGGAGMGGALFINSGDVLLTDCDFTSCTARGGNGGDYQSNPGTETGGGGGGGTLTNGGDAGGSSPGGGGSGGNLQAEGAGGAGGFSLLGFPDPGNPGGAFGGGGGGGGATGFGAAREGAAGGFGGGGGSPGYSPTTPYPAVAGGQFAGSSGDDEAQGGGGGAGLGGAIFIRAGTTTLTDCLFHFNQAIRGLAGSPSSGAAWGTSPTHGQGKGGAIFVHAGAGLIDVGGLSFIGNTADDDAGAPGDDDHVYGSTVPVELSGVEID